MSLPLLLLELEVELVHVLRGGPFIQPSWMKADEGGTQTDTPLGGWPRLKIMSSRQKGKNEKNC